MRRIPYQKPAFVQPKGLSPSNKDAMDKVVAEQVKEAVTEKAIELVEQKAEEVEKKVEETTDKVLDTIQENTQAVAEKVEDAVEKAAKPLTDLIDKLDDDPRVKAVIDNVTEAVAEQLDGREFSCGCFGWMFALRIARKSRQPSPSKSEVIDNKLPELPPLPEAAKETPQSTPPAETPADPSPAKETAVSA
jgi:hypothetical protein